ncbi:hypothetical protein [Vibrio parahaemolyticus]|uniref:hypothetical protein n=1 Tax=Vibrio parahaemolyticus TaxID=670 RepID=UPI002051EE72|nr:hypothetical protein [Vibrio parahaemolyticus]MDF5475569.1 hypothetical protein [Vibrio parahaemolyticus]MDF5486968.1 hypothetical protein [Vibrio parahaemolyticus]MDF5503495.1 hypothetical protein [Vibrio parahaemolyticus]MDF5529568.1 hypothetical protein [Vibrio parahaemolyticus]MDF5545933.1 hypothetical protein [Vibrio parahaemolyticus]
MDNLDIDWDEIFIERLKKDTYKNLESILDKIIVNIKHNERMLLREYRSYVEILENNQLDKKAQKKEIIEEYEQQLIFLLDRESRLEDELYRRRNS